MCLFGSLGHLCFRPPGEGGQLSPFDKCDSDEEDGGADDGNDNEDEDGDW